ncbi:MAG: PDC sensor domain-containing protein [Bdellovibrionales bacterium]|nr:PDC sensor domain-containing protein [Bdellovibrionales bacterium]
MKIVFLFLVIFSSALSHSEELSPKAKASLMKEVEIIKNWGSEADIVNQVKAANNTETDKSMTQAKWDKLSVLDPFVRGLTKNEAASILKKHKSELITEAFLNKADGTKVAFLAKTSGWSHKGKAKHDDPMKNKVWIGKVEVDESTGKTQIQVSVPVIDSGKPIGSLVIGLNVSELK